MRKIRKASAIAQFLADERGGITALSLQMFMASLVLGGLAVDVGNAVVAKTQLQVAADSAAHAAIFTRELYSPAEAKSVALEIAALSMPGDQYGTVLSDADISFGRWDSAAQVFSPDPDSPDAVMVSTKRFSEDNNGVATYMLNFMGFNSWDVRSNTVFETYYPTCFREGFVAQERVEVQSNSIYTSGFCIHSQDHVKVSSNNVFEKGVVVSMPDKRHVELPSSGFSSNSGLQVALRDGSYQLRILTRLANIFQGIENPVDPNFGIMSATAGEYYRDYVKSKTIINLNYKADALAGTFTAGRIHRVTCKQDKWNYALKTGSTLKNAVLITNCRLKIEAGAVIEDAVIANYNSETTSVSGSAGVTIGRDDGCAAGGDVQIVTYGYVAFPSDAHIYGSQIIAAGDISLTANADGLEGVSLVAGGKLDVTSNGSYGFCGGSGMANNYEAAYFRLAK